MRFVLVTISALFLVGCEEVGPNTTDGLPLSPTCDEAEAQKWVGRTSSDVPLPEGGILRVIAPGQAVTMDFNPQRLNLHLDDDGIITRVSCG